MGHFLDLDDDAPAATARLAAHLGRIVRSASVRPAVTGGATAVRCTRRPQRRRCPGYVMVFRRSDGSIAWSCDSCGDEGVITGWQATPFDLSNLDDSDAEGDVIVVEVSADLVDELAEVLILDPWAELLVARAQPRGSGVVLAGLSEAFDQLVDAVASEANATDDRRRQRRLDAVYDALVASLDE